MKNILFLLVFLIAYSCRELTNRDAAILKVGNGAEPQSIDPHQCSGHPGIRIIGALFEGLVVRGENSDSVRKGVAKSWTVSGDGKVYTFTLRKSFWSDGQTIISKDFSNSWKRLINPNTGAEYASLLNIIQNGPAIISGYLPSDSLGISSPNDTTFIVKLIHPTAYFLQLCAFEPLVPVRTDLIEKNHHNWTLPSNIISNGPFLLKKWEPNVEMTLLKNPKYWDKSHVKQQKVKIFPIDHQETAFKMYLNGELDWIFSIPLSKMSSVKKRNDYLNYTHYGIYYYALNTKNPILKNPDLRKALSYSIDRQKIVDLITQGGEKAATGFVPAIPSIPYNGPNQNLFNPELAREYFKKAGYSRSNLPKNLEILYNTSEGHKKISEVVTQMWKKELGINVGMLNYEWKIFLQTTKNMRYVIARSSWIADFPDPYSFLELGYSTNGNNRTGYDNPDYDDCIDLSQKIQSRKLRFKQLYKCEKIFLDDMPIIPIYYYAQNELRHPGISGAAPNAMGMYAWKDIQFDPAQGL